MDTAMKFVLGASLLFVTGLVGCDRTVSHEETTKVKSDGTVKHEQTTVTEHPDGTVTKEKTETKREAP